MDRRAAISTVFIPVVGNALKNPSETKFRTICEGNATIAKAFAALDRPSLASAASSSPLLSGGPSKEEGEATAVARRLQLHTCSAADVLTASGFSRGTQPNASTGVEEAVWALRFAGEEAAAVGASSSAEGLKQLEDVLLHLKAFVEQCDADAEEAQQKKHQCPAHQSIAAVGGASVPTSSSSVGGAGGAGGGVPQLGSASSAASASSAQLIDLDQVRRLKELRAAAALAQKQSQQSHSGHAIVGSATTSRSSHVAGATASSSTLLGAGAAASSSAAAAAAEAAAKEEEQRDFDSVAHLVDKVRLTIHKTGRLRNYSFEARDFTLRRMTRGRMAHLCGEERCLQLGPWAHTEEERAAFEASEAAEKAAKAAAAAGGSSAAPPTSSAEAGAAYVNPYGGPLVPETPGEEERGHCLEAHWHVRNANMIYSYVAHLNPSGGCVLHMGEEYGYQYNSLPGTEHFGKTVLLTAKRVNMETNRLESVRHPNKAAEKCAVCGVAFSKLWL